MKWSFISKTLPSEWKKVETNSVPWSEVTCEGIPCLEKTWRMNSLASMGDVMVLTVGIKIEVVWLMQSGSRGVGFTENISELMVVWWNASHVDWGVIRSSLVRKKELVDLVIVHFRETGEGCYIDEGNFRSNKWNQSRRVR